MRNRILVVEDDLELLELLNFNLAKAGFRIGVASDGASALKLARAKPPNLILLDLVLPELDGLALCEILRRDESTRTIPIIILTALSSQLSRLAGLSAGANDYVIKPFRMKDLVRRIGLMLKLPSRHGAPDAPLES